MGMKVYRSYDCRCDHNDMELLLDSIFSRRGTSAYSDPHSFYFKLIDHCDSCRALNLNYFREGYEALLDAR